MHKYVAQEKKKKKKKKKQKERARAEQGGSNEGIQRKQEKKRKGDVVLQISHGDEERRLAQRK
jgi:hypothetical protein